MIDVSQQDACEQDKGHAQGNAGDFDAAKQKPDTDYQRVDNYDVSYTLGVSK